MKGEVKKINLQEPSSFETLTAGERVELYGTMLTARDAAHKRLFNTINNGDKLPVALNGATIFYVGPIFDEDGNAVAAGPTTASRMDAYAPTLYRAGVKATVGKGDRSDDVYKAVKEVGGVYFAAVGGAGALYGAAIKRSECLCYDDLKTEAVYRFEVEGFPVLVAIDSMGNSVFKRD